MKNLARRFSGMASRFEPLIFAFFSFASLTTISPAMTMVSLFASAIVFPALTAASVGISPAEPAIADTTIPASGCVETLISPSTPESISTSSVLHFSLSTEACFSFVKDTTDGL